MAIIDISVDIKKAPVNYGDTKTNINTKKCEFKDGYSSFLVSDITMCCHTGTHIDAPKHSYEKGLSIEQIPLKTFFGKCTVIDVSGVLTGKDMELLLPYCHKKVLLHGNGKAFLSVSAVSVIKNFGVDLIGTDACSIAADFEEEKVHLELARENIVVIENLDLSETTSKNYTISAFPLYISGIEAAPCRAVLYENFDYWE